MSYVAHSSIFVVVRCLYPTRPGSIRQGKTQHLRRGLLRELEHLARISMAIGGVGAAHAAIVALECTRHARRPLNQVRQDADAVTTVGIDREQVRRSAPLPLAGVKGHHLHKPASADGALRVGIELRVFSNQDPDKEGRVDVLPVSYTHLTLPTNREV